MSVLHVFFFFLNFKYKIVVFRIETRSENRFTVRELWTTYIAAVKRYSNWTVEKHASVQYLPYEMSQCYRMKEKNK